MTVIVTGSGGGIGSAIVRKLEDSGYSCVGIDVKTDDDMRGRQIIADMSSEDFISRLPLAPELGPVSGIVHVAAHQVGKPLSRVTYEDWIRSFQVNLLGLHELTELYRADLTRSGGSVIAIGSIHSSQTSAGLGVYAASKAALESWVRTSAIEAQGKIKFVTLSLGAIDTPKLREGLLRWPEEERRLRLEKLISRTPIQRLGQAAEVADWVHFLLEGASAYSNGSTSNVDGGVKGRLASE